MNKWIPVVLVALVIAVFGLALAADFDGFDRRDRTEVGQVVTTSDGETLVIYDDRRGFFPFGFLIFPLFWFLVTGAIFAFFRRGPWRGSGPPDSSRDAWLDDWHRRAHAEPASGPTQQGA